MADITVTAGNVVGSSSAVKQTGVAQVAVTAGQAVYLNTATQKWALAQADGTALESGSGTQYGIALTTSGVDQPIVVATSDTAGLSIGGTTVVGTVYVVSAAAGGICPWADLVSTQRVTILGVGAASNKIVTVSGGNTGIQHA